MYHESNLSGYGSEKPEAVIGFVFAMLSGMLMGLFAGWMIWSV